MTGTIATLEGPRVVVPSGATGVILNVTAVSPTRGGFVSVRPGSASGQPTTSNLNVVPGGTVPNSVTVQLPASGAAAGPLDIFYGSDNPGTTDIIVDVVGYFTGIAPPVAQGPDQVEPGNIITVAKSGGDFTSIQAAIDSITDASVMNTYLVKVAPGQYVEQITMAPFVSVQGAGRDTTSIIGSGTPSPTAIAATVAGAPDTTLSDVSVAGETSSGNRVEGVAMFADGVGSFTMRNVEVTARADSSGVYTSGVRSGGTAVIEMFDVQVVVEGPSAQPLHASSSSSIIGSDVTVRGSGFSNAVTASAGGTISLNDATLGGNALALDSSIRLIDSQIDGLGYAGTTCHNTTDAELRDLGEDCQLRYRTLMWAKVDAGTTNIEVLQSDGVDLNPIFPNPAGRYGVGQYTVKFDQSVAGCAWSATVNDVDAGSASARLITVERHLSGDDFTLRVRTFDTNGQPVDTDEDDGFTLVVHCVDRIQGLG